MFLRLAARLPRAKPNAEEKVGFPVSLPKPPRRIYILFQEVRFKKEFWLPKSSLLPFLQAFDTRSLNVYDKAGCKAAYEKIQSDVESSISLLKEFREKDEYDNFFPRIAYETINGGQQAPSAPLESTAGW